MMAVEPGRGAAKDQDEARKAVSWIVGRLNVLEYLTLFLAGFMALRGGALVAWVISPVLPLSFRWTWALGSLLLFILPGGFVYLRELRGGRPSPARESKPKSKERHG